VTPENRFPTTPSNLNIKNPNKEMFMCTIDDKATTRLISFCRKALIQQYKELVIAKTFIADAKKIVGVGNKKIKKRNIAYVPNFKRTPASKILPLVGASTCASVNQR
jgi:hypothetical protein